MDEIEHMDETWNEDELDYEMEFIMWWKSPHIHEKWWNGQNWH